MNRFRIRFLVKPVFGLRFLSQSNLSKMDTFRTSTPCIFRPRQRNARLEEVNLNPR